MHAFEVLVKDEAEQGKVLKLKEIYAMFVSKIPTENNENKSVFLSSVVKSRHKEKMNIQQM